MATTIQSISPPLHPYHVVSATSCGTVAKTRSLIISSKAKDKPDQAQAQAQDQGQGKLTHALCTVAWASFLAFCVISLKPRPRTMVSGQHTHTHTHTAKHTRTLHPPFRIQYHLERYPRRRPHVPPGD